jgi:choline dehydrogenase
VEEKKGIYTINGAVLSILKRSTRDAHDPDLFLFGLVSDFHGYYPGYSKDVRERASRYFTWGILKARTHNTGRVAIRSRDPRDPPHVDFAYFPAGSPGTEADLGALVHGLQFLRGVAASYRHLVEEEVVPGPGVATPEQLREFVRNEAWGHHASCTCKIGRDDDPMAVLDSRFRVRGTRGLRVVDASVFPRIPGLFIVSAVYMIAEKASDDILADAGGGA